jgi:hypothetical protein
MGSVPDCVSLLGIANEKGERAPRREKKIAIENAVIIAEEIQASLEVNPGVIDAGEGIRFEAEPGPVSTERADWFHCGR